MSVDFSIWSIIHHCGVRHDKKIQCWTWAQQNRSKLNFRSSLHIYCIVQVTNLSLQYRQIRSEQKTRHCAKKLVIWMLAVKLCSNMTRINRRVLQMHLWSILSMGLAVGKTHCCPWHACGPPLWWVDTICALSSGHVHVFNWNSLDQSTQSQSQSLSQTHTCKHTLMCTHYISIYQKRVVGGGTLRHPLISRLEAPIGASMIEDNKRRNKKEWERESQRKREQEHKGNKLRNDLLVLGAHVRFASLPVHIKKRLSWQLFPL